MKPDTRSIGLTTTLSTKCETTTLRSFPFDDGHR